MKKSIIRQIEKLDNVINVEIEDNKLIITVNSDDELDLKDFQKEIKEITGKYPTPCDVNIYDWFIYY